MTQHSMRFREIQTLKEASLAIKEIGSDTASIPIMGPKMIHKVIQIDHVQLQDAIIIKQDMLSIGGEVAVPRKTFELHKENATILVSGSLHQLRVLIEKLKRHYPRIQQIATELETMVDQIS